MPKIIELTVEIDVQRVSCPGVWLCQDGRVSLTVFALGTSYQTCLLPPNFPLMFKDVFYFRKRFQESCALNNICCLLKDETIYCELVQWCNECGSSECTILAQYLGSLNDVLFPPNMCSNEGVDLLMRRSKEFPGILSPKIEIATKVRIDEVWNQPYNATPTLKVSACQCVPRDDAKRQKQVCHSPKFHRNKCFKHARAPSTTRSRSRSRSSGSRSCCSLTPKQHDCSTTYGHGLGVGCNRPERMTKTEKTYVNHHDIDRHPKTILESRYIDHDNCSNSGDKEKTKKCYKIQVTPCVCEICKRYHELFHVKTDN